MKLLDLNKINISGDTQPRESIDQALINEYAESMQQGCRFPAVLVTYDGEQHWLTDGFHRVAAAKKAGLASIEAHITDGSYGDAVWRSLAANATHGKRRTTADKQRAIKRVLMHQEWQKKSDREIARHLGCSPTTVGTRRKQLVDDLSVQFGQIDEREVTRNGKTYTQDTSGVGARPQATTEPKEPVPTPEAPPRVETPKDAPQDDGIPLADLWRAKLQRMPELPAFIDDAEPWEWEELVKEHKRRLDLIESELTNQKTRVRALQMAAHASDESPSQIWRMLGVRPGDDRAAKRVVRKLQRLAHPDHGGDSETFIVAQNLSREAGL